MESSTLQPEQKAAAVIVALGAEKASKLYKHLSESEIEKLTIDLFDAEGCYRWWNGVCKSCFGKGFWRIYRSELA